MREAWSQFQSDLRRLATEEATSDKLPDSILPTDVFAPVNQSFQDNQKETKGTSDQSSEATNIELTEKAIKSKDKLDLDSTVYTNKVVTPEGIKYTSDDGTRGYIRSATYQNAVATSFKEKHFGPTKEENYTATVNQFPSGIISYEYENGAKIVMRKDHSGWIDIEGEKANSRQIINFNRDYKETSSINISTDSSNNQIQEFSNGAIRKINANGLLTYEKAIGENGAYEERRYDSLGNLETAAQYFSKQHTDLNGLSKDNSKSRAGGPKDVW